MNKEDVAPFVCVMAAIFVSLFLHAIQADYYIQRKLTSKSMVIKDIRKLDDKIMYRLELEWNDICFYSTNIYQIGDKLKIVKE